MYNVFMGSLSGAYNKSGGFNVAIGANAGFTNIAGNTNVFLGSNCGYKNTGGLMFLLEVMLDILILGITMYL